MARKKCLKIVLITLISLLLVSILVFAIYFFSVYFSVSLDKNAYADSTVKLTILDATNASIDVQSIFNDDVTIAEISPHIIDAFVATEDKRFYEHNGVDYLRIGGAMLSNIKHGYIKEGGSTITQQLIKNTQIGDEKTFSRKIKELRLSTQMEKEFSKDQIMEMYLNNIYFGNGLYGIKSACLRIFGKKPIEIDVAESAVLAGIVKNPLKNSPLNSIENATARRNVVLALMYENGKIDKDTYDNAKESSIVVNQNAIKNNPLSPYIDEALIEASSLLDVSQNDLLKSDITIKTNLDVELQNSTANTVNNTSILSKDGKNANKYVIVGDNASCSISAFYCDFPMSISLLRRQIGSTIKPFLAYLPALEYAGYCEITQVLDEKDSFSGYSPSNSGDKYRGKISLRDAIAYSSNTVPVSIANDIGLDRCKTLAQACGITFDPQDTTLPIVLGGMQYGVTGLELLGAYTAIANSGEYAPITFVDYIEQNNKMIYQKNTAKKRAFSTESAYLMTDTLKSVCQYGTAKSLNSFSNIACKTGTVGNAKGNTDALSAVYTPTNTIISHCLNYTCSDASDMDIDVTGGVVAKALATPILKKLDTNKTFDVPDGIVKLKIDQKTLYQYGEIKLASPITPIEYQLDVVFNKKYAPTAITTEYDVLPLQSFNVNGTNNSINIEFLANNDYVYYIKLGECIIAELSHQEGLYNHTEYVGDAGYYECEIISKNKYGNTSSNKKGVYVTPVLDDYNWDYYFSDQLEWFRYR